MTNPPKIVFFDIDDTLYRKYTDTLRTSVREALTALKKRGIITAIATGRSYSAIPAKVRALAEEIGMDLLLTINGQFIRYRGEVLDKCPMDADIIGNLCRYFDRRGIAYAFVADDNTAVSAMTPQVEEAIKHIVAAPAVDKTFFHRHEVFQMLAFYDISHEREIAGFADSYGCKTVRWHHQAVDILNTEGSKARGIRKAVEKLGIDMKDVMAFGDGLNDIEMMQVD